MSRKNANGLTELQQAFADAYLLQPLNSRSAAGAYKAIRPQATNRTAEVEGSKLLRKTEHYIAARDLVIAKQVEEKQLISTEEVIGELKNLGQASLTDLMSWDEEGNVQFKASADLDARGRAAVKGLKVTSTIVRARDGGETETRRMELTMHDKVRPLELLGKYKELGLFTDKIEHSGEVKGSGIVVLPATASHDEWQQIAQQSAQPSPRK